MTEVETRHTIIGFVGLGRMGAPMAVNLASAGYRVRGFDLVTDAVAAVAAQGVEKASSAAEAARGAGAVITMLPSGRHVLDAYNAANGLLASAEPGALLIDCSTIDVASARLAHQATTASGRAAVDAPVSGGVVGAEAGSLTFMVGGTESAFTRAAPILAAMGRTAIHCGGPGSGQAAKICNNMILGVSMVAVSEAFVLGEALGLSHGALYDVASQSSGQCWALTTNCPVPGPVSTSPANCDYRAGFTADLMLKDLTLAQEAATAAGTATVLGRAASDLYARYITESDDGGSDFSGIIRWIRERSEQQSEDRAGS